MAAVAAQSTACPCVLHDISRIKLKLLAERNYIQLHCMGTHPHTHALLCNKYEIDERAKEQIKILTEKTTNTYNNGVVLQIV